MGMSCGKKFGRMGLKKQKAGKAGLGAPVFLLL
jgi:hypothetical protein